VDPSTDHTVYIVHCTDTEGPMYESLEATFERLAILFDLHLEPSRKMLRNLQQCKMPLGGIEEDVARVIHPNLLEYNDSWDKIDAMLERITADNFRMSFPDSDGMGWVYNWFCVDHVGYVANPRRKDCGYHNIFDHYRSIIKETASRDGLQFHFHPSHPSFSSHMSATFSFHDLKFYQILARRIIDRGWFPSVNRAGFAAERPDSHWLLEQWIPFDISNMSSDDIPPDQDSLGGGALADWRRAPKEWVIYHPDKDDYQMPGDCRRYIARCLNLGTRLGILDEAEMRKAFKRASTYGATIISYADHDFRDMGKNVIEFQRMLKTVVQDYPDVRFRYCEATEAFQKVLFGEQKPPTTPILKTRLENVRNSGTKLLTIECSELSFGPQPFLAIRTRAGTYHHDNLNVQEPFRLWTYPFYEHTFRWEEVQTIGIATNDRRGFPHVVQIDREDIGKTQL
jgi:hypothetical protein